VRHDGALLGFAHGPRSSVDRLGVNGSLDVLQRLIDEAGGHADLAVLLLAGIDVAEEEDELREAAEGRGWATRIVAGNDTLAVLRAGSEDGIGVAVTCGTGVNCVGVARDGRHVRFASLGEISGDWGGGSDIGLAALFAAARSEDGRGPRTKLEQLVPAHFGVSKPSVLARLIHLDEIGLNRVAELAPLTLAAAGDDAVAGEIVDRQAAEVVAMSVAALDRLGLTQEKVDVVLGGGVLQSGNDRLLRAVENGLHQAGPGLCVQVASSPPIVGAALLGLDELSAGPEAQARLRAELGAAVERQVRTALATSGSAT
jgi:N-acetylglucosamine kinase-like BadF-type ATPase